MDNNSLGIDDFEKIMAEGEAAYRRELKFKFTIGFILLSFVIILLLIPKTFWIIPSSFTKEKLNPYAEPVLIFNKENILATNMRKKSDFEKLVKIKSLKNKDTYYILPLAYYSLTGRLNAKNKFFFNQSIFDKIALVDFGIVWGDMAKDEYFPKIYSYSREQLSGARELLTSFKREYYNELKEKYHYLYHHSSHTHVIPANKNVMKALNAVKIGQTLKIEGYLVDVYDSSRRRFAMSSLSLTDWNENSRGHGKGGGACEVMYVTKVQIGSKVFE